MQYWAILWLILFSGSLYFQVLRIRLTMIIIGLTIAIFLIAGWNFNKRNLKFIIIYSIGIILNILFTFDRGININDVILLLLRFLFLAFIQTNMEEIEYKKIYINIMTVECIVSLICFLYADILAIGTLPFYHVEAGTVNTYLLTPYYTVGWRNVGIFHRNAGLFLEPGSHQIFINFALLFLLISQKELQYSKCKYISKLLILIITLLTTQSTTGYMCFAVIMVAVVLMNKSTNLIEGKFAKWIKIGAVISLIVLVLVESNTQVIEDKFAGMYNGHSSAKTRLNDTLAGYRLALSNPLFGYGIFGESTISILADEGVTNISNGMAAFLMGAGLVLGVFFLAWTYIRMKKAMPYGRLCNVLIFTFYLLCINSEGGVLARLVYLTFLFEWKKHNYGRVEGKWILENKIVNNGV